MSPVPDPSFPFAKQKISQEGEDFGVMRVQASDFPRGWPARLRRRDSALNDISSTISEILP